MRSWLRPRRPAHSRTGLADDREAGKGYAELVEGIQSATDEAGYQIVLGTVTADHDEHRAVERGEGVRCRAARPLRIIAGS